jgi:hypothetical protein
LLSTSIFQLGETQSDTDGAVCELVNVGERLAIAFAFACAFAFAKKTKVKSMDDGGLQAAGEADVPRNRR